MSSLYVNKLLSAAFFIWLALACYEALGCDYNPRDDSRIKNIQKRNILTYPPSSVLQITVGITLAEKLDRNSAVVVLGFQQNADLPKEPQPVFLSPEVVKGRKFSIFDHLQKVLKRYGYNGEECLKKMICQSAEIPVAGGLLEDIISFVLTPSKHRSIKAGEKRETETEMKILLEAEEMGKSGKNCSESFPSCERTPLDIISSFIYL